MRGSESSDTTARPAREAEKMAAPARPNGREEPTPAPLTISVAEGGAVQAGADPLAHESWGAARTVDRRIADDDVGREG